MLRITILFIAVFMICVATAEPVAAEGETKLILGAAAFLDEDIPFDHLMIGASYAIELTEKLRIEPQFIAMFGPGNDRDYAVTGNIAYDLLERQNIELYVVGGAGLLHHRNQFGSGPAFSGNEAIYNGGIGVKIHVSERLFIAPEFRVGGEPLFLGTISIGYSF
jgi:hypothetical protein